MDQPPSHPSDHSTVDAVWPGAPPAPGALSGVRVLDLSRILSGPFATMTLGDLGADVIKVEDPRTGDDTRTWGPPFHHGESAYFLSVNRNKRSLAVDLKQPDGLALVVALARSADVLVENFRPGTAARLGLSAERLRADNPRLVYASISGYGQDGPQRDLPGYDAIAQAESGLMSLTGEVDGDPLRAGIATADLAAGMWTTIGILGALLERERTGEGQWLDVGLLDSQIALLTYAAGAYFTTGEQPERHGSAHPNIAPYQPVPTVDGSLMIAVGNDVLFERFVHVLGLDHLAADERYRTNPARVAHRAELAAAIAAATGRWPAEDLLAELRAAGIPAGRVRQLPEVLESDHVRARELVVETDHVRAGAVRSLDNPIRTDAPRRRRHGPPPTHGQHSRDLLAAMGVPDDEITRLVAQAVVR